jgi:hypothetical protein
VRDPKSGQFLRLNPKGWEPLPRPPVHFGKKPEYEPITTGLDFDYAIDPSDPIYSGPAGTCIDGAYRPIFFRRDDFERWFQRTFGFESTRRRGRKLGTGSYERHDEPYLREMGRLIDTGAAKSAEDAAGQVADMARGASFKSKRTRLAKRFRARYPDRI